ncbi:MAG TPA: histidine--tRNA ligase [Hyphomonadaceae bacterium]|jgi:histidyl-tRNA synthetase|nr:histidine--tRNA ligase [Hyphomonadaceae bacterium]
MSTDQNSRPEARKPRGFPDRTAAIIAAERKLVDSISAVYARWGFEALDTGPFEYVDVLGKFLPDTDRPNAGVFALQDDDEQWIALRYDHTAPLARYVAENWERIPKPFRRYSAGPVWRNEKPGPFRFREFIQCDADSVGVAGPAADAEMIAIAAAAMEAAGAAKGEYVIRVNSRQLLDGIMETAGVVDPAQRGTVLRALDKFDKFGVDGVTFLLGKGRKDESGDFTAGAGLQPNQIDVLLEFITAKQVSRSETVAKLANSVGMTQAGMQGVRDLGEIDGILRALGIDEAAVSFDPGIVRGLEYYTGPVFEAEFLREFRDADGNPVRFGSVGGGGRYDGLVARFRGEPAPATGFSVGVSRLAAAMAMESAATQGPVLILILDKDAAAMADYFSMADELRRAGVRAEPYLGASGMKAQMKYADRRGSPAVVIVGGNEREKGVVTIKDLAAGAAAAKGMTDNDAWRNERPGQFECPRSEMVARIKRIVGAP